MNYTIKEMMPSDWEQVSGIYLQGINTGRATFETELPSWEKWDESHINCCRLVARSKIGILGWVALSPISRRTCYAGIAEVSIYIDERYKGLGIGSSLLQELIKQSEENGFWTLQSSIMIENIVSIAVHKKSGFREVGIRSKVAKKNGIWSDMVLMERRSEVVGVE